MKFGMITLPSLALPRSGAEGPVRKPSQPIKAPLATAFFSTEK